MRTNDTDLNDGSDVRKWICNNVEDNLFAATHVSKQVKETETGTKIEVEGKKEAHK